MFTTIIATLFVLVIIIIALAGGFFVFVYWRLIQRPVSQLDGEVSLSCLDAPVQVLRDKHGVPHLYAEHRADLFRAQGYVHAQERLWQMEQNRRIARGTLAEIFGEPALDADRFSRIIGFQRAAEAELAILDGETRQILEWYAEGVNAYIESRRHGLLAAEFNLLRFTPAPWTPVDTLGLGKVMAWSLSVNWESELVRLQLATQLDPIRAAELEPDYPTSSPITLDAPGAEEVTRLLSTAGLLLAQYEAVKAWLGRFGFASHPEGQGSNAWVIAPKASLNGRPLLCNDPHLAVSMPGVWYENHLHSPDFAVSGVSFPGAPGVVIGHNEQIAWGVTNGYVDAQDLYIERPHPDDPTRFAYQEAWEQADVLTEAIVVKGRPEPHIEQVVVTRHGPLITGLLDGSNAQDIPKTPLALRWTGHEPGQLMRSFLRINQATNWDEFTDAVADWSTPTQNMVYADTDGYIGYRLVGYVPVRTNNLGLVPAAGWTGAHEWDGFIAPAELPSLFQPDSGIIVTANNKMVGDDYPHFLSLEFDAGWRAARLTDILTAKERFTVRDMEEMQMDQSSAYAAALAPWLAQVNGQDTWERLAVSALRTWKYNMDVESTAATVFHYALLQLLEMVFGDKLGSAQSGFLGLGVNPLFNIHGMHLRAQTRLLELIEKHEESLWFHDAKTGHARTRDELLQEALARAVTQIRSDVGDSLSRWAWGRRHQVRFVHPLGSVRLLKTFFNRGPFPIGGDSTTPLQTRHVPQHPLELVQIIPSYRQIYEVGHWDRAQTVTATGQSGHPLSRQYDDQITLWREGVYHKMPWSRAAVEGETVYRLRLLPAAA